MRRGGRKGSRRDYGGPASCEDDPSFATVPQSSTTRSGLKIVRNVPAGGAVKSDGGDAQKPKPIVAVFQLPDQGKQPSAPQEDSPAITSSNASKKKKKKKGSQAAAQKQQPASAPAPAPAEKPASQPSAPAAKSQPKTWADAMRGSEGKKEPEPASCASAAAEEPVAAAVTASAATATTPTAQAAAVDDGIVKKGKLLDDEVETKAVIPKEPTPKSWKQVNLVSNYFPIVLQSNVYEYGVDFAPSLGDSSKRRMLVHKQKIPSEIILMGNVLYTNSPIPEDQMSWTVSAKESRMTQDVTVTLSFVNKFSKGMELPNRVFAALFQRALETAGYKHIQRNFFNFQGAQKIPGGKYIVIPGIELAVVPSVIGLALVADVTNKVARTGTVLGMWRECRDERDRQRLRKSLEKSVVYTNYNNRSYTVKCVRTDMSPTTTFGLDDGTKISFGKYVENRYGRKVSTVDQPMLECERHGESLFLIPEFCQPTGFEDRDRRDFKLMQLITGVLFPEPDKRQRMICGEVDVIKKNTTQVQLNVSNATTVQGSVITAPRFPSMKARDNLTPANAKVMAGGKQMKRLVVVSKRSFDTDTLVGTVVDCLQKIGLKDIEDIPVYLSPGYESKIKQAKPDFVLFVSPNVNDKENYRDIKLTCTHGLKVPSQVVVEKNLTNPKRALPVIFNVARQMAVKLGKCPWIMPFNPITKGTMVFGLDVCHTTTINKSVVGIVATLDDSFGRYVSDFLVQERGKEIVVDLSPFVKKALEKYKKRNGHYPKNVLFLRDGVGDGQLMYVNDMELSAISFAINEVCPDIKFTFVVVKKHIRTRLFNNGRNPQPGTLVDGVITHPKWYDFFLVSHETRNGTVSPTHYNVLLDEMGWPKAELQLFIYLLCYQYYNWDGSISVPAPCQYAHKMAYLYGRTILSAPDNYPVVPAELEDTLLQS